MDFELTDDQQRVRQVAREFADAELGDKIAPYDERQEFPWEIVRKLGPLGFLGALVDEEYAAYYARRPAREAREERAMLDEWKLSDDEAWAILDRESERGRRTAR